MFLLKWGSNRVPAVQRGGARRLSYAACLPPDGEAGAEEAPPNGTRAPKGDCLSAGGQHQCGREEQAAVLAERAPGVPQSNLC